MTLGATREHNEVTRAAMAVCAARLDPNVLSHEFAELVERLIAAAVMAAPQRQLSTGEELRDLHRTIRVPLQEPEELRRVGEALAAKDGRDHEAPSPTAQDLEGAVLGQMMLSMRDADVACRILEPADFGCEPYVLLFGAIRELVLEDQPPDAVTVSERLERDGNLDRCGGLQWLAQLVQDASAKYEIELLAGQIRAQSHGVSREGTPPQGNGSDPDDPPVYREKHDPAMRERRQAEGCRPPKKPPKREHGNTKLSYDDKVRMRAEFDRACEGRQRAPRGLLDSLANKYGVSRSTAENVCYRKDGT